jgi:hypothetical protein
VVPLLIAASFVQNGLNAPDWGIGIPRISPNHTPDFKRCTNKMPRFRIPDSMAGQLGLPKAARG